MKSYSNEAKKIIRKEISSYDWNAKSLRSQVDFIKNPKMRIYDGYSGGAYMVDGGCFACYYSQTDKMLNQIYGKEKVKKWSDEKKWNTYKHLISREVDSIYKSGSMTVGKRKKF